MGFSQLLPPLILILASLHSLKAFPGFGGLGTNVGDFDGSKLPASVIDHVKSKRLLNLDLGNLLKLIPTTIDLAPIAAVGRKRIPDDDHPFQAPGPGDIRGGCPGLNIMSNYGYISRNGITTVAEMMYGMQEMLGFAADLALSVTILGLKTSIDLTTMKMSIGQTDPRTDGPLSELFGTAPGLSSHEAHNKFEVDGSFSRVDAYWANGNTDHFTSDHWKKYRQLAVDQFGGLMTMDFVGVGRSIQYNECRNTNPECQWTLVEQVHSYAAQGFVSSTMASADEDGNPSPPDIKSLETFFGIVEGPNGTYSRTHGKLPAGPDGHWYRRATPLTFLEAFGSLTETFLVHPTPFGRNNGDLGNWDADLTNLQNVEEANVLCYVLQRTRDPKDSRYASNSVVNAALGVLLHNSLQPLFSQLSCP